MNTPDVCNQISAALDTIESENGATVLYACESGSRAWGFESVDSDYDIRFIYVRRTADYLTILPERDVIERPISEGLDINGWDIRKVLDLFRRSNPPLLEWIQSPIVYRCKSSLICKLRELLPHYYSPIACMHHYLHMAEGNCREYLKGHEVWTKKYFYVLRPVLACIWIERGLGVVPTEFQKLFDAVVEEPDVRRAIDGLLEAKKSGEELRRGPRNEFISSFVERELARLNAANQPAAEMRSVERLDEVFVETVIEVNGPNIDDHRP